MWRYVPGRGAVKKRGCGGRVRVEVAAFIFRFLILTVRLVLCFF